MSISSVCNEELLPEINHDTMKDVADWLIDIMRLADYHGTISMTVNSETGSSWLAIEQTDDLFYRVSDSGTYIHKKGIRRWQTN